MRYILLIAAQLIMLTFYTFSQNTSALVSDILGPLIGLSSCIVPFSLIKKQISSYFRFGWLFIGMMGLTYGLIETAIVLTYYISPVSISMDFITDFLLLIPNLMMVGTIIVFFLANVKHWNKKQMLLDIIIMIVVVLGIASGIFFSKDEFLNLSAIKQLSITIYLLANFSTALLVMVLITSVRKRKFNVNFLLTALAFMNFIFADGIQIYQRMNGTYVANSFSDTLYLLTFVIITLAAVIETYSPASQKYSETPQFVTNIGRSLAIYFVMPVPILFYILDLISLTHLTVILICIMVYMVFNSILQKNIITELTLSQEKELKKELERLVDERTLDLEKVNEELVYRSITDSLTGIHNREYFIELLETKITEEAFMPFSVVYIGINRFKVVNDTHGHELGDRILKIIASRLKKMENQNLKLARIGSDEFCVYIETDLADKIDGFIDDILYSINLPIVIDDYSFNMEFSIGVSRYPKDALTASELIRYADIAMYYAKNEMSSHKYVLHSSDSARKIERRNQIELLLQKCNYDEEFNLHYQPQFDIASGKLIGMEALVRWHSAKAGSISPSEFIPVAEEVGAIHSISDWVFKNGLEQIKLWNRDYEKDMIMSLNISPRSLDRLNFIPDFRKTITDSGAKPEWIGIELTEHSAMSSATKMEEFLTSLSGLGIKVSIDDFGTGYSSLSYLKRFDVDVIKIARELIQNIETDHTELVIIKSIIRMAEGMGIATLAEGVETEGQLQLLRDLQCNTVQGYYTGRPVDAFAFESIYLNGVEKNGVRQKLSTEAN